MCMLQVFAFLDVVFPFPPLPPSLVTNHSSNLHSLLISSQTVKGRVHLRFIFGCIWKPQRVKFRCIVPQLKWVFIVQFQKQKIACFGQNNKYTLQIFCMHITATSKYLIYSTRLLIRMFCLTSSTFQNILFEQTI